MRFSFSPSSSFLFDYKVQHQTSQKAVDQRRHPTMWNTLTIQPLTLSSRNPQSASANAVSLLVLEHILHIFSPCFGSSSPSYPEYCFCPSLLSIQFILIVQRKCHVLYHALPTGSSPYECTFLCSYSISGPMS